MVCEQFVSVSFKKHLLNIIHAKSKKKKNILCYTKQEFNEIFQFLLNVYFSYIKRMPNIRSHSHKNRRWKPAVTVSVKGRIIITHFNRI